MKLLILDFLRRWWWLLAICILIATAFSAVGFPFIFAPSALIFLVLDAQRGVFRAVRVLPIPTRDQAAAWWFIGVSLVPLVSMPALLIGILISRAVHAAEVLPFLPAVSSPWFAAGVQGWVALGYAAFCFLLVLGLPARTPEGALETSAQALFGALWGISIPGLMFILPKLPGDPGQIAPWHWAVFVASPVCLMLSFLAAQTVMQRRTVAVKASPRSASEPMVSESGLTGLSFFFVKFLLSFGAVLVAIAVGQIVFVRFVFGVPAASSSLAVGNQFIAIAIAFGAITGETVGVRVLRTLPLSTTQLALLLVCGPWVGGLAAAALTALWNGMGNPAWSSLCNFAAQALLFSGWSTLTLAVTMYIVSSARQFLRIMLSIVPAAMFATVSPYSAALAIGGTIGAGLGFALLHHGLKKSNSYYQPRRIFGVVAGQAMMGQ